MNGSPRPRRPRRPASYHPQLLTLEERLPLGDGVLGAVAGLALLGPPSAAPVAAQRARATSAAVVGQVCNLSGWADRLETRPTEAFTDVPHAALAEPGWTALTEPFAPAARRHDAFATSPPRQQGPDAAPLLARRALELAASPLPAVASVAPAWAAPAADGALLATLAALQPAVAPAAAPAQEAAVRDHYAALPLTFEANRGQVDAQVHFLARGPGYTLFLTATEAVMVLAQPSAVSTQPSAFEEGLATPARSVSEDVASAAVMRMQVLGGNPAPPVTGLEQQPGVVNYFLGNDPAKWQSNVPTFARVEYDEVYPGIDLVYYGNPQQLAYDFVVAPGVDPSVIRLGFQGADALAVDAAGDLVLRAGGQELRQHAPVVYQQAGDARQEVASHFVLEGSQVCFAVGAYDAALPLVIDPVLSYSTYLGGSDSDGSYGIVVGADGGMFLTGFTDSGNFPTANPFQPAPRGGGDAFVTKLNASGTALVYSTYLGGNRYDTSEGIAVDAAGNAYVTGYTNSTNFPTFRALQPALRGSSDIFVTKLHASGSALAYSSYMGGSDHEDSDQCSIAVDGDGNAYLAGRTPSTDFPTVNPFQPAHGGGQLDAFVAKITDRPCTSLLQCLGSKS